MAILKCKMCGGNLEISKGMSVGECEYCGTRQTIPKADDEKKINAMNRANHFRRQCEFDKAIEVYEKLIQTEEEDAELYWTLALCKYGIEYVDDPVTKKKIPTCHRMQYTSILDDMNYKEALTRADSIQKIVYQEEAEAIASIQKGILDICNKEEPFDVFICYKESDEYGSRTQDSVLAQDIYYGLTEKGFKVFFSRITLEKKLGEAYEPYIFSALNSAKVMIVVGTKPEYVNAVWVKNEWSRFLMLMQKNKNKMIVPAYRGMDPYDLPDALSIYQSQDMSKLGFMQDLIRGITKVLEGDKEQEVKQDVQVVVSNETSNNIALLKRGYLALEDGEWERAFDFFEQVLNYDAENSEAYMGQLLSSNKVANVEEFIDNLLEKTSDAESTLHILQISSEKVAEINKLLNEHAIKDKGFSVDEVKQHQYVTYVEARLAQKEELITYFENDKLLKKVKRFAKSDDVNLVEKLKQGLIPILDARINEATEMDRLAICEVEEKIENEYQELLKKAQNIINEKQSNYDKLVEEYESGRMKKTYRQYIQAFSNYGDYRNAQEYVQKIAAFEFQQEKKYKELQDEKKDVLRSYTSLGLFPGKKRKELDEKLKIVNKKIEEMKKILGREI